MRLAFSTLICPNWTLDQIIHNAAEEDIQGIDFRGVEQQIDITRLPAFNEELPKTLRKLASYELQLPCFNTSIILVSPAGDRWEMMLDECQRYAQLSEKTHTPFLRIFGGCLARGMNRDEGLTLARRHLRQAIKLASPFGCRLLLETHDEWAASSYILELLDSFDPAEVGVLWDIQHSYRGGETPAHTAQSLKPWIAHAHIKDAIFQDDHPAPTLLGQGQLPLDDFLIALKVIAYDGWLSLETEKRWNEAAPDPEQSLPDFARYMRTR